MPAWMLTGMMLSGYWATSWSSTSCAPGQFDAVLAGEVFYEDGSLGRDALDGDEAVVAVDTAAPAQGYQGEKREEQLFHQNYNYILCSWSS